MASRNIIQTALNLLTLLGQTCVASLFDKIFYIEKCVNSFKLSWSAEGTQLKWRYVLV